MSVFKRVERKKWITGKTKLYRRSLSPDDILTFPQQQANPSRYVILLIAIKHASERKRTASLRWCQTSWGFPNRSWGIGSGSRFRSCRSAGSSSAGPPAEEKSVSVPKKFLKVLFVFIGGECSCAYLVITSDAAVVGLGWQHHVELCLVGATLALIPGVESQGQGVVITKVHFLPVPEEPAKRINDYQLGSNGVTRPINVWNSCQLVIYQHKVSFWWGRSGTKIAHRL